MASNTTVQTNILALNAHRNLSLVGTAKERASTRLSSGFKINSAADDAAGLAISEKMRAQIRGLDMASKNAQDGISLLQTAEGGLQEIDNMLQRIRELVVQASNDTNELEAGTDRSKIHEEINALRDEITEMGNRVQFNKIDVLNRDDVVLHFQIGANTQQSITFDLGEIYVQTIVTECIQDIEVDSDTEGSIISEYITAVDAALSLVTTARAKIGAVQNRLEYTNKSLNISSENLSNAESRIRDADMGKEMMNLTKANILQQVGVSMLSQANQQPQSILQLLQ